MSYFPVGSFYISRVYERPGVYLYVFKAIAVSHVLAIFINLDPWHQWLWLNNHQLLTNKLFPSWHDTGFEMDSKEK